MSSRCSKVGGKFGSVEARNIAVFYENWGGHDICERRRNDKNLICQESRSYYRSSHIRKRNRSTGRRITRYGGRRNYIRRNHGKEFIVGIAESKQWEGTKSSHAEGDNVFKQISHPCDIHRISHICINNLHSLKCSFQSTEHSCNNSTGGDTGHGGMNCRCESNCCGTQQRWIYSKQSNEGFQTTKIQKETVSVEKEIVEEAEILSYSPLPPTPSAVCCSPKLISGSSCWNDCCDDSFPVDTRMDKNGNDNYDKNDEPVADCYPFSPLPARISPTFVFKKDLFLSSYYRTSPSSFFSTASKFFADADELLRTEPSERWWSGKSNNAFWCMPFTRDRCSDGLDVGDNEEDVLVCPRIDLMLLAPAVVAKTFTAHKWPYMTSPTISLFDTIDYSPSAVTRDECALFKVISSTISSSSSSFSSLVSSTYSQLPSGLSVPFSPSVPTLPASIPSWSPSKSIATPLLLPSSIPPSFSSPRPFAFYSGCPSCLFAYASTSSVSYNGLLKESVKFSNTVSVFDPLTFERDGGGKEEEGTDCCCLIGEHEGRSSSNTRSNQGSYYSKSEHKNSKCDDKKYYVISCYGGFFSNNKSVKRLTCRGKMAHQCNEKRILRFSIPVKYFSSSGLRTLARRKIRLRKLGGGNSRFFRFRKKLRNGVSHYFCYDNCAAMSSNHNHDNDLSGHFSFFCNMRNERDRVTNGRRNIFVFFMHKHHCITVIVDGRLRLIGPLPDGRDIAIKAIKFSKSTERCPPFLFDAKEPPPFSTTSSPGPNNFTSSCCLSSRESPVWWWCCCIPFTFLPRLVLRCITGASRARSVASSSSVSSSLSSFPCSTSLSSSASSQCTSSALCTVHKHHPPCRAPSSADSCASLSSILPLNNFCQITGLSNSCGLHLRTSTWCSLEFNDFFPSIDTTFPSSHSWLPLPSRWIFQRANRMREGERDGDNGGSNKIYDRGFSFSFRRHFAPSTASSLPLSVPYFVACCGGTSVVEDGCYSSLITCKKPDCPVDYSKTCHEIDDYDRTNRGTWSGLRMYDGSQSRTLSDCGVGRHVCSNSCDLYNIDSHRKFAVIKSLMTSEVSVRFLRACVCVCVQCSTFHDALGRQVEFDQRGRRIRKDAFGTVIISSLESHLSSRCTSPSPSHSSLPPSLPSVLSISSSRSRSSLSTSALSSLSPLFSSAYSPSCTPRSSSCSRRRKPHRVSFRDDVLGSSGFLYHQIFVESYKEYYTHMRLWDVQPGERLSSEFCRNCTVI